MGKIIGCLLFLGGIAGVLYSWVCAQKKRHTRLEQMMVLVQKAIFAMEEEKVRMIDFFEQYDCPDEEIMDSLQEIVRRLRMNCYPKGERVWEEVLKERKEAWGCPDELFSILLSVGNGFFGKNRSENICFLKKSLAQLENGQIHLSEKVKKERRLWIPVGMLGGVMVVIIFI